VAATTQTLDYPAIAEAQRDCPSIQAAGDSSLTLQLIPSSTVRVLCNTKGRHLRPVIPLASDTAAKCSTPFTAWPTPGEGHEEDNGPESDMVLHEQGRDTVG